MCGLFQKQEKGGRVKGARGHRKPHIQEINMLEQAMLLPHLCCWNDFSNPQTFGKGGGGGGKINKYK